MKYFIGFGVVVMIVVFGGFLSPKNIIQAELEKAPVAQVIDYKALYTSQLEKVEKLKTELLHDLAMCESSDRDGIVIVDSDQSLAWGKYQWKRKSIQGYVKELYNRDIDLREAGLIAFDAYDIPLDELTWKVLENGGEKNWVICGDKIDLSSRVATIKELGDYQ